MEKITLSAPIPINDEHDLSSFHCGVAVLDDWLKHRALKNEVNGASRTYVLCLSQRVAGYYALAAGSILRAQAPGPVRRNMPDSIPIILLGKLAIDQSYQKKGIGKALLRDAILRTFHAAQITGIRALIVDAISEAAKHFYKNAGFQESPLDPMLLMIPLETVKAELQK